MSVYCKKCNANIPDDSGLVNTPGINDCSLKKENHDWTNYEKGPVPMTLPGSEKATPRPWTWAAHIKVTNILGISRSGSRFVLAQCRFGGPVAMANAALIVEAVNGWDALKEENRRLRAALEEISNADKYEDEGIDWAIMVAEKALNNGKEG